MRAAKTSDAEAATPRGVAADASSYAATAVALASAARAMLCANKGVSRLLWSPEAT
ncbi:Uncharacterised protein [Mycobacterium tuberculosis]|nr:Uncharacterised protein [Mycobacterium tuberculosis]